MESTNKNPNTKPNRAVKKITGEDVREFDNKGNFAKTKSHTHK